MIDTLITNKTRRKLLWRFILNSDSKSYLRGLCHPEIDVMLVGDEIDKKYLDTLIAKAEGLIQRSIKCLILLCDEENEYLTQYPEAFLLWEEIRYTLPDTGYAMRDTRYT